MEKLMAMHVAAQLAHAAAGNATAGAGLPISPAIDDTNIRAKNLMVWEAFRVFYHAVIKALENEDPNTGWPAPKSSRSGALNLELLAPIVQKFLGALATQPPPAAASRPQELVK